MLSKLSGQSQHPAACMHPQYVSKCSMQPLVPLPPSSGCRGSRQLPTKCPRTVNSSHDRTYGIVVHAKPDRGSLAALEAAIGAINGILGAHTKRSSKQKQQQQGSGPGKQGSAAAGGAKPAPGPSKLITFSAKASGSVPVKEWYKIQEDTTDRDDNSSSSSSSSSSSRVHHKVPSKPPPVSDWARSLQSYLSLPLEQYSVLDPTLITRLPPGTDTELLLTKLLAARKERRTAKQQQQQREASAVDPSSSSSSSSGTSLQPKMKQLQEQVGLDSDSDSTSSSSAPSNGSSDGSSSGSSLQSHVQVSTSTLSVSTSSGGDSSGSSSSNEGINEAPSSSSSSSSSKHGQAQAEVAAAAAELSVSATPAAAAAAEDGEAGGCFLLRIPMEELVGVALEPLLIITVDIDPVHGQVKFRASRLVVGDERFDAEFKVDVQAVMNSKITKQPHVVHAGLEHDPAAAAAAAAATNGSSSSGVSNNGVSGSRSSSVLVATDTTASITDVTTGATSSSSSSSSEGGLATSAAAAAISVTAAPAQEPQQQQQQQQALFWQRTSALSCKVNLSMTLRLPYPLSIVPGPLLSTTAGLVAKLVIQSLLPSFLELLATDYGRWSTGVSRAAPVGSLVAAGKQHIKQQKQQQ